MRVLLDHCVPRRWGRLLTGHEVRTTHEMGWSGLKNGALLRAACKVFDVFVTVDQNLEYQQNLLALPLPVVLLVAPDNRYATLSRYSSHVLAVLNQPLLRELIRIEGVDRIVRLPTRNPEP